jgi:hypothetical protein
MISRLLATALLLCGLFAASSTGQMYLDLPVGSWANDITPDGKTVVGTWDNVHGFIWN